MANSNRSKAILAGITGALKGYSDIMAERQKIQGDIMINRMKSQDNWFARMQEENAKTQQQKELLDYALQKNKETSAPTDGAGGQPALAGSATPASPMGTPRVSLAGGRLSMKYDKPVTSMDLPMNPQPLSPDATSQEKEQWLGQFPTSTQAVIKGIADYTIDPAKSSSLFRSNARQAIIGAVKMYNPKWDERKFMASQGYLTDLSKGQTGQNVLSLNTVAGHLGELNDSIEGLSKQHLPAAQGLINFAQQISGNPNITDYDTARRVVNSELERALTGVGVTQEGIQDMKSTIPTRNIGYDQLKQFVKSAGHLIGVRLQNQEYQYKQRTYGGTPKDDIIFPENRDILKKLSPTTKFISDSTPEKSETSQSNAPKVDTIDSGYRFKGGDPSDQNNWEKI
jgi:hypothetical protein